MSVAAKRELEDDDRDGGKAFSNTPSTSQEGVTLSPRLGQILRKPQVRGKKTTLI